MIAAVPAWGVPPLVALGLLGAVLALDETALGQTWLSQPLPAAVLAGLILGDVRAGLLIGAPLQLICLGNMPVGRSFLGDQVAAAVSLTGALAMAGPAAASAAVPATGAALPTAATVGWLLLAAVPISAAGHLVGRAERRAHLAWMLEGSRTLRDGNIGRLDGLQERALAATALRGLVMTVLATTLARAVWLPLAAEPPAWAVRGLATLPVLPALLAAGVLAERFGVRASWRWLLGGAVTGWLLGGPLG